MKIPIYRLEFEDDFIAKYKAGSESIFRSDGLSDGPWVRKFEQMFSEIVSCKHAISVTSGTAALEIALKTIDVKNKRVLIPSNTFFATSIAVINAGGIVDLLEVESENFSICPEHLKQKISTGVGAVVIVHIGGIISKNFNEIRQVCNDNNIPLIEDAAHAHGSSMLGEHAGTIGKMGCFSFFPTKVMTTGEGGMITTNSDVLAERARSLMNFGRDPSNASLCVNHSGQNSKISEFTGLLGVLECERVLSRVERRNKLIKRYEKNLTGSSYRIIKQDSGVCSYYKCILITKIDKARLKRFCKENGISMTGEVYSIPIHQQPAYEGQFFDLDFPVTDMVCDSHVCPPLYPELTDEEVDYVCKVLLDAEVKFL